MWSSSRSWRAILAEDPPSATVFLRNGQPPAAGQRLVQRDLARTLEHVAKRGGAGFYSGPVADAVVAASVRGGGIIRKQDLASYRAKERAPIACDYRGYQIVSAPPPSSGGVVLCEILGVLEAYPLKDWGFRSARSVHYQIEAMRHAYLDRNSYLGDPDFVRNPIETLLDKSYAAKLRAAIDPAKAGRLARAQAGSRATRRHQHHALFDRRQGWQCGRRHVHAERVVRREGHALPEPASCLNNEMDDFTAKPGVPNVYGLVQGEANAIAPGKRPLSSMSPTIVLRDGKPVLVIGNTRRQPHHHRRPAGAAQHDRLRDGSAGGDRRSANPPAMAAGDDVRRAVRLEPGYAKNARGHGPSDRRSVPWSHADRIMIGSPWLGGALARRQSVLRRDRSAPQHRLGAGILTRPSADLLISFSAQLSVM
jgi:gamma-glutamyltranspeptidase